MNASASNVGAANEINRLHDEVKRLSAVSRQGLFEALEAAWRAGQLLIAEKKRVRRTMGSAWLLWLEQCFHGTPRTAQKYMLLADSVTDISTLRGMSLRQTYLRLGIATEPKSPMASVRVQSLPPHLRFAHRLLATLRPCLKSRQATPEQWDAYRRDLRPLYEQLRRLFEAGPVANVPKKAGIVQGNATGR